MKQMMAGCSLDIALLKAIFILAGSDPTWPVLKMDRSEYTFLDQHVTSIGIDIRNKWPPPARDTGRRIQPPKQPDEMN
jgi:hypothetical protein